MTPFLSAARALLLGGLLTATAHGQTRSGDALARSLALLPQEYTVVTELPALGVPVRGGAVRLKAPRPLKNLPAANLRALQESLPAAYGLECTAPLDLTVVPSNPQQAAALVDRWTRETRALVLSRQGTSAAFLSGHRDAPVLTTVREGQQIATLIVSSCPVRENASGPWAWSPVPQFADPPTLVAVEGLGGLAWCRPGASAPLRNVQAYAGGVHLAARSRDGALVATVGWDRGGPALKVWRSQDARMLSRTPLLEVPRSLSFTEDGRSVTLIARTEGSRTVNVVTRVNAASGQQEARLALPSGEQAQAVSGDGRRVVTTLISRTRTLRVREISGGSEVWSVSDFQATQFAFARGDTWLGGANEFGRLESWRASDGQRGPETFVAVHTHTVLAPGLQANEVSVVRVEGTSLSAPGRWTLSAWRMGTPALTAQGTVNVTGREGVVIHPMTGELSAVPFCQAALGLPLPLSGS